MKIRLIISVLFVLFSVNNAFAVTLLQGQVYTNKVVANSLVIIQDALNNKITTTTNDHGFYQVDISALTAPILLSSNHNSLTPCNIDSAVNCVSSLANTLQQGQVNIANINFFTDLIVSNIALKLGYIGPEQLIQHGIAKPLATNIITQANQQFYNIFASALQQIGINRSSFNPTSTTTYQMNMLLELIVHNRGYDANRGQMSSTQLFDMRFNPIDEQTPFDYHNSLNEKKQNLTAKKRIFILSDSTASNYTKKVYPRMGWGQVFNQFINNANTVVINGAQSGRSSRSFYDEGWFEAIEPFMQKGDYMIIAFGHNDEKCDSSKLVRGQADIAHLCTYPNDRNNNKQYPAGQEYMSFQTSLERYLKLAKEKGMIPILMTPITRFRNANNKIAYQFNDFSPVVSNHYTAVKHGVLYSGNYADTVKFVAKENNVGLIDLEKLTIDFANKHKDDWQSYWLAIDTNDARYTYYQTQSLGTLANPDTTHFQEKGALAIANMVAKALNYITAENSLTNEALTK
ncbi:rhamnogalacturonan acetylesterase [Orbus wheelerorum]|uniref:rhamnogalacturonan acetylesterase n=1 Tax=Orbus wheelerorum TaxID=3074111 RepID=UPI00370D151B